MIPASDPVWMDIKRDRITHAKAALREECKHSDGCEDDCFACKREVVEPVKEEPPPQALHTRRCLNCLQFVLTTTGMDPLNCWKCRDLLKSSNPWHQDWYS